MSISRKGAEMTKNDRSNGEKANVAFWSFGGSRATGSRGICGQCPQMNCPGAMMANRGWEEWTMEFLVANQKYAFLAVRIQFGYKKKYGPSLSEYFEYNKEAHQDNSGIPMLGIEELSVEHFLLAAETILCPLSIVRFQIQSNCRKRLSTCA